MQLFVLGMHRSGTSAVTRILNLSGAYFGHEGISNGADEGNPKGFWERLDVRAACDGLLRDAGADWWRLSEFSLDAIPQDARDRHLAELRRILLELDAHRPWVLKEPRLCLLFPLLRPMLETPVCIHVIRDPIEVAASLRTRNGFPMTFGLALWELYSTRALIASEGLPRVVVQHEELVTEPIATASRLLGQLAAAGVEGLQQPIDEELTDFVSIDLHRERRAREERGGWLNERQAALATALDAGTPPDIAHLQDISAAALEELRGSDAHAARVDGLAQDVKERDAQLKELSTKIRRSDAEVQRVTGHLDATEANVARLKGLLEEVQARAAEQRTAIQARATAQRASLQAERAAAARGEARVRGRATKALEAAEEDVRALARSRTWRIAWRLTSTARALRPGATRPASPVATIADRIVRSREAVLATDPVEPERHVPSPSVASSDTREIDDGSISG